ncbi:MAG: T9SS type A sorting domain-containing protein [Ignavibacteriaceae bacterium]
MNKYYLSLAIAFLFLINMTEQTYGQKSHAGILIKEENTNSYPIAGSDLLKDEYSKTAQFLKNNPDYFSQTKLRKTTAWNFTVGSKRYWTAYSYETSSEYSVYSTCKAVGTHCYIFVADDVWGTYVDSSAVLAVANDFDNQTPANPNKGIYQTDVDTFGDPPDVDNDPRIIILILDIKDGYSGSGGYVAGYFSSGNELRGAGQAAEIYFMDANPTNLKTTSGLNNALSTAAHEFQHMINWNYHKTKPELTFINEGLSMTAEVVCGYGTSMQTLYANEPNHYLFDWRSNDMTLVLNDYARAQRFFLYLKEQFGVGSLKQIVQDNTTFGMVGISGLSKILSNYYSTSLGKVFLNWEIANGLNNTNVNSAYGYLYQPIPVSNGTSIINPNIRLTSSTLQNLGAEYFTYSKSSNLNVTFSSTGTNIIVKALEIGTSSSRVVDVPLNSAFTEPDYPNVYNTIRFAAIDTNLSSAQDYQYQSSGTITSTVTELIYDDADSKAVLGAWNLSPNDTIAVFFDGLPGAHIDSLVVGLRNDKEITGSVFSVTNAGRPGHIISNQFALKGTSVPSKPFPVPWPNMVKIDLRDQNIDAGGKFCVIFVYAGTNGNNIVITSRSPAEYYHSLTYLNQPSSGTPGWFYLTSSDSTVGVYVIRAYVSLITDVANQGAELTPTKYSLSQNYPNPFNPATTINFQIAEDGFVSLKVYDILGNEVKTLVNEYINRGSYHAEFNGAGLASGIYFYKLQTDGYTAVKKLMLLK